MSFKQAFILLAFSLLTASCSRIETTAEADSGVYIFSAKVRAGDFQSVWEAEDAIGISAYISETSSIYSNYINRKYQTDDSGFFVPSTNDNVILRPLAGEKVDFVAYYPYKAGTSDKYAIDLSDQSSQKAIDILYSNNVKNRTSVSGDSEFVFNHILSKIIIYPKPGNGIVEEDLQGMSVAIDNIYDNAELDLRDGSLDIFGTKSTIVAKTSRDGDISRAIVLPGTSGAELTINLVNGNIYRAKFPEGQLLKGGTCYYYNVEINRTDIVLNIMEIVEWTGIYDPPDEGTAREISYKLGDFYPNPTDPKTAIGIVYWTHPASDGREGKIVSFDTAELEWSNCGETNHYTSIVNGLTNLTLISSADPSLQQFPAFRWCAQKGDGWYLPSRYELHILHQLWLIHGELMNRNILFANGEIFTGEDIYLVSSESRSYPETMVERYNFADKGWPPINKTVPARVRAVKQF
jgi:hypothetical protein